MRSLSRIRELRDAEPNGETLRYRIFSQFLIQPSGVGPHAGCLRRLNYEDYADYNMFRRAVSKDFQYLLDNCLILSWQDKLLAQHIYNYTWEIFEGKIQDIPEFKLPEPERFDYGNRVFRRF